MAVVTTKTTRISNAEAAVQTLDSVGVNHGRVRRVVGTLESVSGDSIASIYRMVRVHSSWSIVSIKLFCDALGGTAAADVGLYQTTANPANGGAVVDVDAYATATTLVSAITTGSEIAYEVRDIANCQRQVWQDAGLTSDPNRWYELALTLTAASSANGTVTLDVLYVGND